MKQKKRTPSKPKLDFSVDRSEFDISSEWVQAVMAEPSLPPRPRPFFSGEQNTATDAGLATVERYATEEITDTAAVITTDEDNTPVVKNAIDKAEFESQPSYQEINATEEDSSSVAVLSGREDADESKSATAVLNASVEESATVAKNSRRGWKSRPLVRLTDGLTPGQFAVYTVMAAHSEPGGGGEKIYRGGYADIGRLTGLSKRGIQNVVADLQEKAVIRLHTTPGHHRLQTSAYAIPEPDHIIASWHQRGWRFAVGKSKKLINGATVAISS